MASDSQNFNLSGPRYLSKAIDWSNAQHRTTVAASLVQGVYVMERDREKNREGLQALAHPWWDSFNFQLYRELIDNNDSSIFGAIYEFKFPIDTFREGRPPRYVIAFRGTVIRRETMCQDFKLNLKLFLKQKLTKCYRVEQALEVAKTLAKRAGAENVWLAGHSLGSAIALRVGRNMVKEGFLLETYLFNPPYISVPLEQIGNATLKSGARIVGNIFKAGLSKVFVEDEQRAQEEETFIQLSVWTPYLCVNGGDPICSEYIGYFADRLRMERFGAVAARIGKAATKVSAVSITRCALGRGAEPYHLLPTAYLVTNTSVMKHFKEAHGLEQWWTASLICQRELHKY